MSSKHKRTKACAIYPDVRYRLLERDGLCCIFCGKVGLPEAHIIPRSQGGLGVEENLITVCRECHYKLDHTTERKKMLDQAIKYLKKFYPNWKREDFIYDKWRNDKEKESSYRGIPRKQVYYNDFVYEKTHKDKGEPPDGFRFL